MTWYRPNLPALTVIGGLAVIATCAYAADWQIVQKRRSFSLSELSVALGDLVIFSNEDEFTHQVYIESPGFNFDSGEQPPGEVVRIRFTKAGTFDVMCRIHPKMKLHVTVQ